MTIRRWKQSVAAGLLVAGTDGVAGEPPAPPDPPILYAPAPSGVWVAPATAPCPDPRPAAGGM